MKPTVGASAPEIRAFLNSVRLGATIELGDRTVLALLAPDADADADLLEDALARGTRVTEVTESGRVNSVRIGHPGPKHLLLIDGEEIVGAKQNRILNASFLVPPASEAVVPVSCVERGRWSYRTESFRSSARTVATEVRSAKLRRVASSLFDGGDYDADQSAVWRDVDSHLARSGVTSSSSAYSDAADRRASSVEARLERLAPVPGQVGFAAMRGNRIVALDLFGSPSLYARGWKKLARGVLADVGEDAAVPTCHPTAVEEVFRGLVLKRALERLALMPYVRREAPGCGETLHGATESLVAGALVHASRVYHLVVGALRADERVA